MFSQGALFFFLLNTPNLLNTASKIINTALVKNLVIAILIFLTNAAYTQCDCNLKPITEEIKLTDEVFVGALIGKKINVIKSRFENYHVGIQNDFVVIISFVKHLQEGDTVSIVSGDGVKDCGYVFDLAETYLVYARRNFTDLCRRTKKLEGPDADEEVEKLFYQIYNPKPTLYFQYFAKDSMFIIKEDSKIDLTQGKLDTMPFAMPPLPVSEDVFGNTSLTELQYANKRSYYGIIPKIECSSDSLETNCNKIILDKLKIFVNTELKKKNGRIALQLLINKQGKIESFKHLAADKNNDFNEMELKEIIDFLNKEIKFVSSGYKEMLEKAYFTMPVYY